MERAQPQQPTRLKLAPASEEFQEIPWSGKIRPGKLRRPERPARTAARPRLTHMIDQDPAPLTLIVAPAGFGKTTVAGEWADTSPQASWITLDSGDAAWPSFWAHVREALARAIPGLGDLVQAAVESIHRPTPLVMGRMLADELLEVREPVRLVLDDLHLAESAEVLAFLDGLLEAPPAHLRLLITSRREPALHARRLRIRGQLKEIHAADLLFTDDEVRAFGSPADGHLGNGATAGALTLLQRTGGWAAGLRLASLIPALPAGAGNASGPPSLDIELATMLLEETLEHWDPVQERILLAAASSTDFTPQLVAALTGDEQKAVAATLRFARTSGICHPSPRFGGEWLEIHPLFREALLARSQATHTPLAIAQWQRTAAAWFERMGMPGEAIEAWLHAGDHDAASQAAEAAMQAALGQEEWPAMARYLEILPDALVRTRPRLLIGRAWIAHLRGQYSQKIAATTAAVALIAEQSLEQSERAALLAELDALKLDNAAAVQASPVDGLERAGRALAGLPPDRQFPIGIATMMTAMALASQGSRERADSLLHDLFAQGARRQNAASIRGLLGLSLLAVQEGNLTQVIRYARSLTGIAEQEQLRLSAGWGRAILADALYDRNHLEESIELNSQVGRDHAYCHFYCVLESQFALAQAYLASGQPGDARRTWDHLLALIDSKNAAEALAIADAYGAYLELLHGDRDAAVHWATHQEPVTVVSSLYAMLNPALIKAIILLGESSRGHLDSAEANIALVQTRATQQHFTRPLVRTEALTAILHLARGERGKADEAFRSSLATGLPRGFTRAYLDLGRLFPQYMEDLHSRTPLPAALSSQLKTQIAGALADPQSRGESLLLDTLTVRELQILSAFAHRLSYDEIAERLFISPHTVKRHACNIYSKFGVSGRSAALRTAHDLGWRPAGPTA